MMFRPINYEVCITENNSNTIKSPVILTPKVFLVYILNNWMKNPVDLVKINICAHLNDVKIDDAVQCDEQNGLTILIWTNFVPVRMNN